MFALCFSPRSLSSFCRAMVGAVALVALFVASEGILQAQPLDLASLDALEGPHPLLVATVAPIDLSSLQELEGPLAASGLDLSSLQELEAVQKPAAAAPKAVAAVKPSPPAVVPATTMPAGMVCVNGQCFRSGAQPQLRTPRAKKFKAR